MATVMVAGVTEVAITNSTSNGDKITIRIGVASSAQFLKGIGFGGHVGHSIALVAK
jgi:hypothetical protein